MSLRFYIVGRERRRLAQPASPANERRGTSGPGHYIGLRDPRVSRRHAEIYVLGRRIFVRDLDSKNGTFVIDGEHRERITEGFVEPRQFVSFGGCRRRVASLLRAQNGRAKPVAD